MNVLNFSRTVTVLLLFFSAVSVAQKLPTAELLWIDSNDGEYQLKISEYINDEWAEETLLYASSNPITSPALGTGKNSRKLIVWTEQIRSKTVLKSMSRSANNNWQLPNVFSNQGFENYSASIVFDLEDVAWVFWSSTVRELSDIYYVRSEGLGWSTPVLVNAVNDVPDLHPRASLTLDGKVEVRWSRYSFENNSYVEDVYLFDEALVNSSDIILADTIALSDIPLPNFLPENRLSVIHFPSNHMLQTLLISSR